MDSSAVDFEWYRSFIAVYREGTMTRAAKARLLTQPAVSQHVAALEAIVGRPLFQRLPRRMAPTDHGEELYTRIAPAVDLLEQTASAMPAIGAHADFVRLGGPAEFLSERLVTALGDSGFRWRFRFGDPGSLIGALNGGEIDLIVATQRLSSTGMDWTPLFEEALLPYGAAGATSMATRPPAIDESWLLRRDWIAYAGDLPLIRRFWRQVFGHRPTIDPVLVVPDLCAIRTAIEAGVGASVLPTYLVEDAVQAGRLEALWQPTKPVTNQLWLASRRSDRTNRRVVDALLEVAATVR